LVTNILSMLEESPELAQRVAEERIRIEIAAAQELSAAGAGIRPVPIFLRRYKAYASLAAIAAAIALMVVWMLPGPVVVASIVASIGDSIDAQWSDPNLSTESGTQLLTGENLVLIHGVVEIAFAGGAKMIVEAPATLELLSADSARLVQGRLVGLVPRSDVQLTIKTPGASITDLGTEFGVSVDPQRVTHLHVFQGRVSVATFDANGKTTQQQTVFVNKAVHLQPKTGAIEPAPVDTADRFVRRLLFPLPLYSTGVGLAEGDEDPHWTITTSADDSFSTPGPAITQSNQPAWLANGPNSSWISVLGDGTDDVEPGVYVFETTFDLSGMDPSTAVIVAQYAVDDTVTDVLINGTSTGISGSSYSAFIPFTISKGFIDGVNTLEFVTVALDSINTNTGPNPHGLCVEIKLGSTIQKTEAEKPQLL